MNPLLAFGQILVSIALIVAILLQARGTGLSGTFGGDSAVYRSRRGVERRLWQFTIVLLVLFVVFSLASFIFAPVVRPPDRRGAGRRAGDQPARSPMTRTDTTRRRDPRRAARAHRGPRRHPGPPGDRRHRQPRPPDASSDRRSARRIARASSATRSRSARSRRGPRPTATSSRSSSPASSGTGRTARSCRTSPSAGRSTRRGKTWTFELRDDARWHDGEPVTADDVVFTIETLQDPDYTGPAAESWTEVTVEARSRRPS